MKLSVLFCPILGVSIAVGWFLGVVETEPNPVHAQVDVQRNPDGGVTIRAPFVRVRTSPYGTRVRAPFTQVETDRLGNPYQFAPEPYGPNPFPGAEPTRAPIPVPASYVWVEVPTSVKVTLPEPVERVTPVAPRSPLTPAPAPQGTGPQIELGKPAAFPDEVPQEEDVSPPTPGPSVPLDDESQTDRGEPVPVNPILRAPGFPEESEPQPQTVRKPVQDQPVEGFPSTLLLNLKANEPLPPVKIDLYHPEPGTPLVNPLASNEETVRYGLQAMTLNQVSRLMPSGAGTHLLAMIHPMTGQTICFPVKVPEGNVQIQMDGPFVRMSYPTVIVDLQFLPNGQVSVEYSQR